MKIISNVIQFFSEIFYLKVNLRIFKTNKYKYNK